MTPDSSTKKGRAERRGPGTAQTWVGTASMANIVCQNTCCQVLTTGRRCREELLRCATAPRCTTPPWETVPRGTSTPRGTCAQGTPSKTTSGDLPGIARRRRRQRAKVRKTKAVWQKAQQEEDNHPKTPGKEAPSQSAEDPEPPIPLLGAEKQWPTSAAAEPKDDGGASGARIPEPPICVLGAPTHKP